MKTLVIDACTSDRSRTRKLTRYLCEKLDKDMEIIRLNEQKPYSFDMALLEKRDAAIAKADFSDDMFKAAKQFANAENIIVAAPYWDLSFPAVLKQYIESINVCGLTFGYSENGMPVSMSNAKRLIYITTAGGYIVSDEFGFGYIKKVMELFYGVKRFDYIKAEGLDIIGADIDAILEKAKEDIDRIF
ncbi:MAG: NAD(P)H-dependent oxidoreductase [Firmicutes bacterium]|nr:NAD(P)H-dependent oxidoreductase [Bacillota bacterium]